MSRTLDPFHAAGGRRVWLYFRHRRVGKGAGIQNREQELWACAIWVEKHHGPRGPDYIGEQVTRLAMEGDMAGVATWRAIAERYDAFKEHGAKA